MFKCKVFGLNCPKTLHLPLERRGAPVEIRIVTMAEFHKNGSFELFLWNCAAAAARINRKAVYSVDIIYYTGRVAERQPGTPVADSLTLHSKSNEIDSIDEIVTLNQFLHKRYAAESSSLRHVFYWLIEKRTIAGSISQFKK